MSKAGCDLIHHKYSNSYINTALLSFIFLGDRLNPNSHTKSHAVANQPQTYCSMHPSNRHTQLCISLSEKKNKKLLLWLRKPTFTTPFLPDTNSHTNTSVAHCCFSYPHLLRHTKRQTTVIEIKSYIHERLFFADHSRDREHLGPACTKGKQSITLCMMCIDERENVIRVLSAVMFQYSKQYRTVLLQTDHLES